MPCKRLPEAEAAYSRALELKHDYVDARFNLSIVLLALQRYQEAWPLYESRYAPGRKVVTIPMPNLACPQWQTIAEVAGALKTWASVQS